MRVVDDLLLTEDGWRGLKAELEDLRNERQTKVDACLQIRRDGETASTHELGEVAHLGERIAQIETALARALVIRAADREPNRVGVGSVVDVRWADGDTDELTIVSPVEATGRAGRISYESPVGRALLGRCTGDLVDVSTPGGQSEMEILAVR
jgi:transcription elongation factor GreA